MKNIGDFLISFDSELPHLPTRGSKPWQLVERFSSSFLYISAFDDQWHGFPVSHYQDARWHIWALGEFYDTQPIFPLAIENPNTLNGHFLIFAYNSIEENWHVITNRSGSMHAYYYDWCEHAAFGTYSPAIAAHSGSNKLNWESIYAFFNFGFFLDGTTYWKDISLFEPATHTILNKEGRVISKAKYWHSYYEPNWNLTYGQAIDRFKEIFEEVLIDQVEGKQIALPLSGGLDSRSTLAVLGSVNKGGATSLFPFSYGYADNSPEIKIATDLANARSLDIRTWTIRPYLFENLTRISKCLEGFQDITQARQAFVVDDLGLNATHVVAAHWGDVWLDDMGFLDHPVPNNNLVSQIILDKYRKSNIGRLPALFSEHYPANIDALLKNKIEASLDCLDEISEIDFKVKIWKTEHWSHRWTLASIRMYQSGLFPLLPFYDNRLIDFFCQLPSVYVQGRQLQIDYLKKYAPDLAKVKWQAYDANLFQLKYFNNWLIPHRIYQKAKRAFSDTPVKQRNWEVQFLTSDGRSNLSSQLLENAAELHKYCSRVELESMIDDFFIHPGGGLAYCLSMLLTFSSWLELNA